MGQAKVKRENERLRDEVLKAAVAFVEIGGGHEESNEASTLIEAVKNFQTRQPVPDSPVSATGAQDFTCPHCGEWNPPYGWHYNIGDTGLFALQWITCFCGSCKTALTVNVVQFLPRQELMEKLKAQFAGKIVQA